LIRIAAADGRLPIAANRDYTPSMFDRVSEVLGLAGLVGLVLYNREKQR
jgi:hypothetical protein